MTKRRTVADAGAAGTRTSHANGPTGQVSRSVILHCALRIVDRDGVDGLSMRRLSEQVGRDPTVLYRHIPNKAALLDGIVEIVLGQLRVDTEDPDWAAQLRSVAHDFRRLALAHPNVVPLLVTRPLATPLGQRPAGMLRPLEDVVERPEETDDVLRLGLHRLTITEFPQVRALAAALGSYDGAAELDRGVDLLLIGLTATLTPPGGTPRS